MSVIDESGSVERTWLERAGTHAALLQVTLLVFAFNVIFRWFRTQPLIAPDEPAYLAAAQLFAGLEPLSLGASPYYYFGAAVPMAPLFWISSDPEVVYRAIMIENGLLCALLVPLGYFFLQRLGVTNRAMAILCAAIVACWPAYLYPANAAQSESLFRLLFLAMCLLFLRALDTRSTAALVLFSLSSSALYATHPRALAVPPVALLALAAAHVAGRASRRAALVAAASLAASFVLVALTHRYLAGVLTEVPQGYSGRVIAQLKALTDPQKFYQALTVVIGQAWYQVVGTLGLVAVGTAFYVRKIMQNAVRDKLGAAFMLLACASVFAASAAQMLEPFRLDHVIYGRYVDGASIALFLGGMAALNFVALSREETRAILVWSMLFVTVGSLFLFSAPFMKSLEPANGNNIGAISAFIGWPNTPADIFLQLTLGLLVAMLAMVVTMKRRVILPIVAGYCALSLLTLWPKLIEQSRNAEGSFMRIENSVGRYPDIPVYWDAPTKHVLGLYNASYNLGRKFADWPPKSMPPGQPALLLSSVGQEGRLECLHELGGTLRLWGGRDLTRSLRAETGRRYVFSQHLPFIPCASGWSGVEAWGRWSDGASARLQIALPVEAKSDFDLIVSGRVFLNGRVRAQRVLTKINDEPGPEFNFQASSAELRIPLPPTPSQRLIVELQFPDAASPSAADPRKLAFGAHWLCVARRGETCRSDH